MSVSSSKNGSISRSTSKKISHLQNPQFIKTTHLQTLSCGSNDEILVNSLAATNYGSVNQKLMQLRSPKSSSGVQNGLLVSQNLKNSYSTKDIVSAGLNGQKALDQIETLKKRTSTSKKDVPKRTS